MIEDNVIVTNVCVHLSFSVVFFIFICLITENNMVFVGGEGLQLVMIVSVSLITLGRS